MSGSLDNENASFSISDLVDQMVDQVVLPSDFARNLCCHNEDVDHFRESKGAICAFGHHCHKQNQHFEWIFVFEHSKMYKKKLESKREAKGVGRVRASTSLHLVVSSFVPRKINHFLLSIFICQMLAVDSFVLSCGSTQNQLCYKELCIAEVQSRFFSAGDKSFNKYDTLFS